MGTTTPSTKPTTAPVLAIGSEGRGGLSMRRFESVGEPVGAEGEREGSSKGKSTVSELFIEHTRAALGERMGRPPGRHALGGDDARRPGIADGMHIVALGISTEGREGPAQAVGGFDRERHASRTLLADLVDRGLDPGQAILFVIDGVRDSPDVGRYRTARRRGPCS
jgi:hypothetical protein